MLEAEEPGSASAGALAASSDRGLGDRLVFYVFFIMFLRRESIFPTVLFR